MRPEEIRDSVIRYYDAYYAELRRLVPEYASVSEAIPDFLKDHKRRIVVAVCRDGAVLEHRVDEQIPPGKEEFFEFHYYYRDRTISDISGFDFKHDPNIPAGLYMAEPRLHEGTDTTGPVVWEAPWQRMEAVNNRMISSWSEELGRAEATNDVLTLVNAHLMGLAKVPPQEVRQRVIAELEAAVNGFAELLDSDPGEERVQVYLGLKRNKILLEPSAVSITPKVKLGSEYVTDFVIELPERKYVLVEIEQPGHSVFTQSGRVTAKVTEAQQQVEDWFNWIRDHSAYAREEILPGLREPEGWVILGRRHTMSDRDRRALAGRNANLQRITIMTFDDVLDRARQHLQNLRGL